MRTPATSPPRSATGNRRGARCRAPRWPARTRGRHARSSALVRRTQAPGYGAGLLAHLGEGRVDRVRLDVIAAIVIERGRVHGLLLGVDQRNTRVRSGVERGMSQLVDRTITALRSEHDRLA